MRRLLFFIVITAMGMGQGLSQTLIQTYVDRCTGQVSVFSVPMNGSTVVAFYNKSRTFTAVQFQNGELQAWLEETYLWWNSLSPCSTSTTGAQATQATTQQTTQQATQAATNAAQSTTNVTVNASPPPTNTPPTTSTPEPSVPATTDTSVNATEVPPTEGTTANVDTGATTTESSANQPGETAAQQDTGGTDSTSPGETQNSETNSEASTSEAGATEEGTQETSQENSSENTTDESQSEEVSTEESSTEETSTEESSTEESTEETSSDESSEESSNEESNESEESSEEQSESEEESTEESESESEEESSDEESDESTEEDSEEETDEEESESEESEEDEEEDSNEESDNEDEEEDGKKKKKKRNLAPPIVTANAMAQQMPTGEYQQAVTLGISQSSLLGDKTYGLNLMVYDNLQQYMLTANFSKVHINKEGRVSRVYSASLGGMKMFTTYMTMMNHSMVWLGEKGSVKGLAFGTSLTWVELDVIKGDIYLNTSLLGTSLTGFYTKSFEYSPKLSISPMLAVSSPFMQFDMFQHNTIWNTDLMIIGGSNFTYKLTQRFGLNFGVNVIESTMKGFPTMKTFTIGGRLSF